MKKILSLTLAVLMVVSMVPTAFAADVDYQNGTEVEFTGSRTTVNADGTETHNAEYTITVPALLAPGGSGTVTLQGMWPSDATVKVTAEDKVEMVNNINSADKKELAVTFASIEKAGSNTAVVTASAPVSVANIENALFGKWAGKFNYNVDYVAGSGNTGDSGTTEPSDPDTGDDGEQTNTATFTIKGVDGTVQTYTTPNDRPWCNFDNEPKYEFPAGLTKSSTFLRKMSSGKFYYLYLDGVKVNTFDYPQHGAAYELVAES